MAKIGDPDVIVIPVQRLRHIIDKADTNYEAGYTAALLQLRNRITVDNPKQDSRIKRVLDHIQDLLGRCDNCGGWLYALDKSCLTCETSDKVVKKKPGKSAK